MDITFEKLITVAKVVGIVSSGFFSGTPVAVQRRL
jgi:hypothetical protein